MIVSEKAIFISVPKCGSTTGLSVLEKLGTRLHKSNLHLKYSQISNICSLSGKEIVYAIWRDPVDRFLSSYSFLRENKFSKEDEFYCGDSPLEVLANVELGMIRQNNNIGMVPPFYNFQSAWLKESIPNLRILPFSDYESSIKTIIAGFGGDTTNVVIPKLNETGEKPIIDDKTRETIKEFYIQDYKWAV